MGARARARCAGLESLSVTGHHEHEVKGMNAGGRTGPLSREQHIDRGKRARVRAPREAQGEWRNSSRQSDPLVLLIDQEASRVPELVPIRHGRMAASAFAFYRGAALPMAADLSTNSSTGLDVQLCGDAHLSNFGGFASPERDLVFDINDFDETAVGPFEWDVKRLATSFEVAGRELGYPDRRSARHRPAGRPHLSKDDASVRADQQARHLVRPTRRPHHFGAVGFEGGSQSRQKPSTRRGQG